MKLTSQSEAQSTPSNSTGATGPADEVVIVPNKIHLRGLDNLTTDDIKAFVAEYTDPGEGFEKVEWIDDTSANLVYSSQKLAWDSLVAFSSQDLSAVNGTLPTSMLPAKSFPAHPETRLEIRVAVSSDRKQAGARDRSRFYLMNPEYDPAERRKNDGRRRYRQRDDGGYRTRIYDDREQRRREENESFDASMYEDDEQALAARASRKSSASSEDHRIRKERKAVGIELFPSRVRGDGRLRNRSASPARGEQYKMVDDEDLVKEQRRLRNERGLAETRRRASLLKSTLKDTTIRMPKELFPTRFSGDRKAAAFDATDETADLLAKTSAFGKDDSRYSPAVTGDLSSRITKPGLSIKGAAKPDLLQGVSIKGSAAAVNKVKELFPMKSGNVGKELFGDRLEARRGERRKAEDMFK